MRVVDISTSYGGYYGDACGYAVPNRNYGIESTGQIHVKSGTKTNETEPLSLTQFVSGTDPARNTTSDFPGYLDYLYRSVRCIKNDGVVLVDLRGIVFSGV